MNGLNRVNFTLLRWQRAERELERRQAQRQLVQPRQSKRQSPFPPEVSTEKNAR